MAARIKLEMDPADRILLKRKLNKNGEGQRFFTHEVNRLSVPYIPWRTGNLAEKTVTETATTITYNAPYARRQFYENRGTGLRGKEWTPRMWADRGKEIVEATAKFCGGRAE